MIVELFIYKQLNIEIIIKLNIELEHLLCGYSALPAVGLEKTDI